MKLASGVWEGPYDWRSRAESGVNTNPEELIAAAHAGCFNMAFTHALGQAGHTPNRLFTQAHVVLNQVDGGFAITEITLQLEAEIDGIGAEEFQSIAHAAKEGCPVSKALAGTTIHLEASLAGAAV